MIRYKQAYDNEWIKPVMRGYRIKCCDCGLVHEMDFKVIPWGRGRKVLFRARRVKRSARSPGKA